MSVCQHDPKCPGYGPDHDQATSSGARPPLRRLFGRPKRSILKGRVRVPGVDQEAVDRVLAERKTYLEQKRAAALAMMRTGRPFANHTTPARKRSKKTAHVRRMERARAAALMARAQRGEVRP